MLQGQGEGQAGRKHPCCSARCLRARVRGLASHVMAKAEETREWPSAVPADSGGTEQRGGGEGRERDEVGEGRT